MASFADVHLDPGIARGLKRGDERAQAVAYRVLAPTIMGLAVRILQDEGLAQEVLQDTFVELIEHASALKEPEAVIGWVRKVAVNHCLMRLRSPWHQRRVIPDATQSELEVDDVSERSARNENLWDIEHALADLPSETRMVIWLHDVEGYTHQEIGSLSGRSASYSKSQLSRGYRKLSERFRGSEDPAEGTQEEERKRKRAHPVGAANKTHREFAR